jgi:hypothetical protein
MKKLTKKQKAFLLSKAIELMVASGRNIEGYLLIPASKIDFLKVLVHIIMLEELNKMAKNETFLFNYPEYSFLITQ